MTNHQGAEAQLGFTFGSLFAGIGGIDLGLENAGMECKWQVEIDDFCLKVLEKHWPNVKRFKDIKDCGKHNLRKVDLICGGFPCQPVSVAGKKKAQADIRWLWPEFHRIIRLLRPRYALVENVPGLLSVNNGTALAEIFGDLAESGYDCQWDCIPAAAVGAPHLRYRVFVVAYAKTMRSRGGSYTGTDGREGMVSDKQEGRKMGSQTERCRNECEQDVADATSKRETATQQSGQRNGSESGSQDVADTDHQRQLQSQGSISNIRRWSSNRSWWSTEPDVGRVAHGVPSRVDRLKALGNAVIPEIAKWIGRRILEFDTGVIKETGSQ